MMQQLLIKILARHLYLKLIIFGLVIQTVSLFRSYPETHPCGRIVQIAASINVLINCDSSVYMKDAQDISRLFDGRSVYQDRPLLTILIAILVKAWHVVNLPNYSRDVIGNSGELFNYSLIVYVLFIFISALIFSISCFLGIKTLQQLCIKFKTNQFVYLGTAVLFTSVVAMNEITKTFFWTPGSQMFNLLLPVYAFYLTQLAGVSVTNRFYLTNLIIFNLLLYCYAFFIILLIPLILIKWNTIVKRLSLLMFSIIAFLNYPNLVELFGGKYYSYGIEFRRLYVWLIDSYKSSNLNDDFYENMRLFINTFHILPLIALLILFLVFNFASKQYSQQMWPEMLFFFFHVLMISLYGYYSRRLTYPLILFLILVFFKKFFQLVPTYQTKVLGCSLIFLSPVILFSWIYTLGPLI